MASLDDPNVRGLRRQLVDMQTRIDRLERGLRSTQLGNSSIEDGYLLFNDGAGYPRGRVGKQPDGKFGWGAVNGDPPPRPNTPILTGTSSGVSFEWNGEFAGIKPSDFTYVVAHLSAAGSTFIADDSNAVGRLLGAGTLPVIAINSLPLTAGVQYWGRLIAYNSSGVASEASFTAGPVQMQPVVAAELLDGIVHNVNLAIDAVEAANIAAGAVGETEIAPDSIKSPHVVARAIDALRIAVETIQAENMATDSVDARIIQALSIVSDHITANAVQAGHIEAGSITADHLAAVLILASKIIAGDPDGWRLELGDATTPILFWDGVDTGFAVSRDAATGLSNVYLSGRVEFGNGSQIESDYLDLAEQPNAGFQAPVPRQQRSWIDSGPKQAVTARWVSATQPGNLLIMSVYVVASVGGSGAPAITAPSGWTYIDGVTLGTGKLLLYQAPASSTRSAEAFTASLPSRWAIGLVEYTGMANVALDVYANASSAAGTTASSGTTATTTQAAELQFAVWASPTIGYTNGKGGQFTAPTNGFSKLMEADGYVGLGFAIGTKAANALAPATSDITLNKSVAWLGVIATFKTMPAAGVPPTPATGTLRVFSRSRAGYSTPHVIDNTGALYPIGRVPYCRVYLTADGAYRNADHGNLFAQSDWSVGLDPYGMAAISSTAGVPSSITVPVSGNYHIDFKSMWQTTTAAGVTANVVVMFVTKNAIATANSVARNTNLLAPSPAGFTDGSHTHVTRVIPLVTGDILYWGWWCNTNASYYAGRNNIPTEITVTYLGPN